MGAPLYGYIEEADILLVLDAEDFGEPPESLIRSDGALPAWLGLQKLSAHQNSFAELLALADLKNTLPQTIVLFGFQPLNIEFGAKLSQTGREAVAQTVPACLEFLRGLGIPARKVDDGESLIGPEVLGGWFVE